MIADILRAVLSGDLVSVANTLDNGGDIEARVPYDLHTPLILASGLRYVEIVNLLLRRGACVKAHNRKQQTALLAATGEISLCITPAASHLQPLDIALQNGPGVVDLLLDHRASINARDYAGCTPLINCVRSSGETRPAKDNDIFTLLKRGAKVNVKNSDHVPALHYVGRFCSPPIINAFFDRGANFEITDDYGRTPLLAAAMAGRRDNAERFMICGAKNNARDRAGKTLFDYMDFSQHELMELGIARQQWQWLKKRATLIP